MSNDNPYGIPQNASEPPLAKDPVTPRAEPASPVEPPSASPQGSAYQVPPQGSNYQVPPQAYPNPGYAPGPQGVYQPTPQKPRELSIAYAFLYFLGIFGGHKFYLGQTAQGWMYLGAFLAAGILSVVGIGFLITLFMMVMIYADIRTMDEQLQRSEHGEKFTNVFEFLKKAFK